ncbi:UDP-3-O-acyl-N-acetylglucosamine deacetylase [Rickettsiales bacterium]|nr:UDP-3-O-acyl-N-acetylglucosamine deacetylase [Rickettsiales bacterium]
MRNKVSCFGVGLHSGVRVDMTLHPSAEDTGITFRRTDVDPDKSIISANYLNVTKTKLGTTIENEHGVSISTIEHLMAALWGCGIDNCVIDVNGPEIPIMDGSSEPFVFLIDCAGKKEQSKTRRIIEVLSEIRVAENDSPDSPFVAIAPSEGFSVDLEINFNDKVISKQDASFDVNQYSFKNDISRARTFGFEHEVDYMRSIGLARGGSLENAIVVGKEGILNEDELRYNNEFVRHKILDCIGDVYLAGGYIKGHVYGYKSGHCLNNKLLREFFADKNAWRIVQPPSCKEAPLL